MSFAQPNRTMRKTGVPLAAMLDIMFLLLIFFVTTYQFRDDQYAIDIDPPATKTGKSPELASNSIIVNVTEDGRYLIYEKEFTGPQLGRFLADQRKAVTDRELRVFVNGDKAVQYGRVVEALDIARRAGVARPTLLSKKARPSKSNGD